jgi:hypothetical protein
MTYDAGSQPPPGWGAPPPPPPRGGGPIPPGYVAASPYGWGGPTRDHPNGTTVLVLGILSLVVCGILGPFAWSMGSKALKEMDAQPGVTWGNRGNITAGRVCGIIGTCFLALGVAWLILWVGIFTSVATR